MADFILLDELEQDNIILPNYKSSISNVKNNNKILKGNIQKQDIENIPAEYDIITIDKIQPTKIEEEEEEHICIKEGCDASNYYGCPSEDGGFKKDNLFSELTDEYQRAVARINLGIADSYALKWGNITGNLYNQKDLYNFVIDSIAEEINQVIEEINLKLAQWAAEIELKLNNKADIFSPNFKGEPTVPLPPINDDSNRIASTQWVNAKLGLTSNSWNINYFRISPSSKYIDEPPVDITITWDYKEPVTSQSINDIVLDSNIREYTLQGINDSCIITLKYSTEDKQGKDVLIFENKYPLYYGTSVNVSEDNKTTSNTFTVNASPDQYIYIILPNIEDAELSVNGIIGGFNYIGMQQLYDVPYYTYKSANKGLGLTKVVLHEDEESTSLESRLYQIEQQLDILQSKSLIALE